eukprot:m.68132 g.68132  ORF g.68132 m.68132 type:complete len:468 (+) comp11942_c0_seq1:244-1647(+)
MTDPLQENADNVGALQQCLLQTSSLVFVGAMSASALLMLFSIFQGMRRKRNHSKSISKHQDGELYELPLCTVTVILASLIPEQLPPCGLLHDTRIRIGSGQLPGHVFVRIISSIVTVIAVYAVYMNISKRDWFEFFFPKPPNSGARNIQTPATKEKKKRVSRPSSELFDPSEPETAVHSNEDDDDDSAHESTGVNSEDVPITREQKKKLERLRKRQRTEAKLQEERQRNYLKKTKQRKHSPGRKGKHTTTVKSSYSSNPRSQEISKLCDPEFISPPKVLIDDLTGDKYLHYKCRPDGRCLPSAIARVMEPDLNVLGRDGSGYPILVKDENREFKAQIKVRKCVEQILQHKWLQEELADFYDVDTIRDEARNFAKNDDSWGMEIHLYACAELLKRPIQLWRYKNGVRSGVIEPVTAGFMLGDKRYKKDAEGNTNPIVDLLYSRKQDHGVHDNNPEAMGHYDLLQLLPG